MAARDKIHDAVKNAIIKDGWIITADPYTIQFEDVTLEADLAAERPFAAEREGQKIVVEIKSFISPSPMRDLEGALGQYLIYRSLLEQIAPEHVAYLAVGEATYTTLFQRKAVQFLVKKFRVALLVVRLEPEEVVQWIR